MTLPDLTQFRIEPQDNGLIHFVFDCAGKSMNVFSNKAIHELGQFVEWLHRADVKGVVVRSGKPTGFCAGADMNNLNTISTKGRPGEHGGNKAEAAAGTAEQQPPQQQ